MERVVRWLYSGYLEIVINRIFASKCHKRAAKDEHTKRRKDRKVSKDGEITMDEQFIILLIYCYL